MTITEAEARQLEILATSLLRLVFEWREQRKKNESAADAYHAGYRAAQEAARQNFTEEAVDSKACPCRDCCSRATELLARQRWTGMRTQDLRRKRDEALEAARMMSAELDDIRRGESHLGPEEGTSP